MSSNTSTVSTPVESIAEGRSPCFEANVPMTYHTKQFLFAIGSPDFPQLRAYNSRRQQSIVQLTNQLFRPIDAIALK